MAPRLNLQEVAPDGFKAVFGLESYVRKHVEHDLYELLKLRASMINGCAFCVDMHTTDWLAAGEDVRRVVAVSAWRESAFFSERERIVLELTDAVTRLGEEGVPDDLWNATIKEFGEEATGHLVLAVATINVWNRIAVTTHAATPPLAS